MIPELEILLSEYETDLTALMERLKSQSIPAIDWEVSFWRMVNIYSQAAQKLALMQANVLGDFWKDNVWMVETFTQNVTSSKEFNPEWKEAASLIVQHVIQFMGKQYDAVMKDAASYQRQLTNDVHALYSRAMNRRAFIADAGRLIERELKAAWVSGADEMMVLPEDMTDADNAYIAELIQNEKTYLDGFADDIQNAAAEQAGWQKFEFRIRLWIARLQEVENKARIYFGEKQKLIWQYGDTEHCETCLQLNGIVAWATEWEQSGIAPQSRDLKCHGYNCQCTLTPTSKRRTRKALVKIMSIVGR